MRKSLVLGCVVIAVLAAGTALADEKKADEKASVTLLDDCDRTDPAWVPLGGCTLKGGAVTVAEFNLLLFSPLSAGSPVGHPAWRMNPTYLRIDQGETLRATNGGGRQHTFTEVANFGGGFIAPLDGILTIAPECAALPPQLLPGTSVEVKGLTTGNHRFQCCIHPWMRFLVKVGVEEENEDKD